MTVKLILHGTQYRHYYVYYLREEFLVVLILSGDIDFNHEGGEEGEGQLPLGELR